MASIRIASWSLGEVDASEKRLNVTSALDASWVISFVLEAIFGCLDVERTTF